MEDQVDKRFAAGRRGVGGYAQRQRGLHGGCTCVLGSDGMQENTTTTPSFLSSSAFPTSTPWFNITGSLCSSFSVIRKIHHTREGRDFLTEVAQ